jgi:hypothetical protein
MRVPPVLWRFLYGPPQNERCESNQLVLKCYEAKSPLWDDCGGGRPGSQTAPSQSRFSNWENLAHLLQKNYKKQRYDVNKSAARPEQTPKWSHIWVKARFLCHQDTGTVQIAYYHCVGSLTIAEPENKKATERIRPNHNSGDHSVSTKSVWKSHKMLYLDEKLKLDGPS